MVRLSKITHKQLIAAKKFTNGTCDTKLKFFLAITLVMSYFAEPNHIEYDAWFDENIDPIDLVNYLDEKEFSDSVHDKFHKISTRNLTIGSSDNFHW